MSNCKFVFDKLSQPNTHLNTDDLTPNQKKLLWEVMMRHGASQGFAYDRFFKEGFREWELIGVEQVKKNFLEQYADAMQTVATQSKQKSETFYDFIGRAKLKLAFVDYMSTLGMGANSVLEKFGKQGETDFRNYERIGIYAVISEFQNEVEDKKVV